MKRHGHLWDRIVSFEALLRAAEQARKGKRFRPAVAAFHFDQERALWKLHEELSTKTYRPGAYRSFFICEPKKRQISAAPYRDRVVHHAPGSSVFVWMTGIDEFHGEITTKGREKAIDEAVRVLRPGGRLLI